MWQNADNKFHFLYEREIVHPKIKIPNPYAVFFTKEKIHGSIFYRITDHSDHVCQAPINK